MFKWRFVIVNALLLIAFAGSYWGRHIDDAVVRQGNFLQALTIPFNGWRTTDTPLSASDMQTLEPDSVLVRNYLGPRGEGVQLAVIAGHRKRSIHTPAFCMAGGGWETLSQQNTTLQIAGRTIPATRELMTNNGTDIVVTYFFTDGDYCSPSLTDFQAVQLLKRFRRHVPMGALVRVIVPVTTNERQADALSDQFATVAVPPVMSSLRNAQLEIR